MSAPDAAVFVKSWDWRRGYGAVHPGIISGLSEDAFHAYDVNDNAACVECCGLGKSRDQPTEGSVFCGECVTVVRAMPAGRPRRAGRGT